MVTPGQRIKQLRKERKWTQADLSEELKRRGVDVHDSMISLYESDRNSPTLDTLDAMAAIFGVSLDWLRCRSEIRNPDRQLAALNYPSDVIELADRLKAISNGLRRYIIGYAGELLDGFEMVQDRQMAHMKEMLQEHNLTAEWEKKHKIKIPD